MRRAIAAVILCMGFAGGTSPASACDDRFPWTCANLVSFSAPTKFSSATKFAARPAGCPARAWCGCWLALHTYGKHVRGLWLARSWARIGRPASGPAPGVIAVYARGRRGGHVGIVRRVIGPGRIVLLSGNDGRAVRERERSTRGVIAWRRI